MSQVQGSGVLKEEKKINVLFFSTSPSFSYRKLFFSLSPELMITKQNNSSRSRMCFSLNSVPMIIQQQCILLEEMFLLLKNLLNNPVIFKSNLWEWTFIILRHSFEKDIQSKKYIAPLITLASGALSTPF